MLAEIDSMQMLLEERADGKLGGEMVELPNPFRKRA
jgi:hypothetical protein